MRKKYETSQRTRLPGYDGGLMDKLLQPEAEGRWDFGVESLTHRLSAIEDGERYYQPVTLMVNPVTAMTKAILSDDEGRAIKSEKFPTLCDAKWWAEAEVAELLKNKALGKAVDAHIAEENGAKPEAGS